MAPAPDAHPHALAGSGVEEPTRVADSPVPIAGAIGSVETVYAERERLRLQAVAALTEAARLPVPHHDASRQYSGGLVHVDVAEMVASVLASVAANLGSLDRLLAGRPGSWEADLVAQLVGGTVGPELDDLCRWRTDPVVVPLDVPSLAWQNPDFPDLDRALATLWDQSADLQDDAAEEAEAEQEQTLITVYGTAYTSYAQAFTAAVQDAAAALPGLQVPVTTISNTDLGCYDVRNPWDDPDPDLLVTHLWSVAYDVMPIPTLDLPAAPASSSFSTPPAGVDEAGTE